MLVDLYPQAVQIGISSTEFWSMTFDEIMVQVEANKKRHENELREKAMFDYSQQRMAIFAFNDPKNFPKFEEAYPFLAVIEKKVKQGLSDEEQRQQDMERDQAIMMQNISAIKATQERHNKK
ncbi:MAG: hypothetical protein L0F95_10260 [Lactococcus sp.]|nr:hypothetical protein [Lactococcus sp.]MDN5404305.1 hypothetical protein [Lactococcus sp.]MDN5410669.1 hypothetical protein [Lactococcus sp.]MDN5412774.1 hypothetical protein [Lactococcus sp.]MDN5437192.1 hypothetical protein [Lactococcus sp.]MDN5462529.1 hypothetical protein [Lactococcus sp.]